MYLFIEGRVARYAAKKHSASEVGSGLGFSGGEGKEIYYRIASLEAGPMALANSISFLSRDGMCRFV